MLVDFQATPLGRLRAVFRFDAPRNILIELSINPVGAETPSSHETAQILRAVGDGQLAHFIQTPSTAGEADWDEVMAFAKCCHEAVRSVSGHVITTVRIEDATVVTEQRRAVQTTANGQETNRATQAAIRARAHLYEL